MQIVSGQLYKTILERIYQSLPIVKKRAAEECLNGVSETSETRGMGEIVRNPFEFAANCFCDPTRVISSNNEHIQGDSRPGRQANIFLVLVSLLRCRRGKKYPASSTYFAGSY